MPNPNSQQWNTNIQEVYKNISPYLIPNSWNFAPPTKPFHIGSALRISTWNAGGLFALDPVRRGKKLQVLDALLSRYSIVALQETHDDGFFSWDFCTRLHCGIFFAVFTGQSSGGTATFVSYEFLGYFSEFSFRSIVPGRISLLTPVGPNGSITIANVHREFYKKYSDSPLFDSTAHAGDAHDARTYVV